ncbi:MAG: fibronectin type III domain-containing protein [Bacteroidales bacterium]|nr:fibronectin type III domain-containing protein [Bacteroidales bacterium]
MKNIFLTSIVFILLSFSTLADTRFYRAAYRDDPSTTIVIGWCDNGTSSNAKVYYGTDDFSTMYDLYPNNHSVDRTQSHNGLTHRFARLTGLQPNTVYYFVVKDDQSTSARMSFKTLSDDPNQPVMFISGGDTRTGTWPEYQYDQCRPRRQLGNQLVAKIRPDFVAFSGDFTFLGSDSEWSDWFTDWQQTIATATKNRVFACVPVFGNHEDNSDLYNMFDIPNASNYFAIDIGGKLMRLYALNSDLDCDATQLSWFTNDLQLYTGTTIEPFWKAIQYHVPLVPHGEYTPQTSMINCWASLFPTYKIKLAMEGHTHIQKITNLIAPSSAGGSDNGFITDNVNGTCYLGEGCWGAPLRELYTYHSSTKAFNWTYAQDRFAGFSIITVTKPYIKIQTVKFENVSSVAQVQENDPSGTVPSGLTFWNMAGSTDYFIYSNLTFSADATLSSLGTSSGTLSPVFSPSTLNYTVELPSGTSSVPMTFAVANSPDASVSISPATNLTGSSAERTTTITVTAEDLVTINNYTIEFVLVGNSDATLSSLTTSAGTLAPVFSSEIYDYSVVLPAGTTTIPTVSATTSDPDAEITITQPTSVDGTATVVVVSQDETNTLTYTVNYSVASATDKEILDFVITGQLGSTSINQTTGAITVQMPAGTNVTNLIPTIVFSGDFVTPASGIAQDFTNPVNYTVTAFDASTKVYSATVEISSTSNNANLASLSTDAGDISPVFLSSVVNYTCIIDSTITSAIIYAETEDPLANVYIYPATNLHGNLAERTGMAFVVAGDNSTTKNYKIVYIDPTGVEDIAAKSKFNVYPNPTTGKINIEKPITVAGNYKYGVYNGFGKEIISNKEENSEKTELDLNNEPAGTFFLIIQTENGVERHKIIKIK